MHLWCSLSRYSLNYFLFPLLLIICLEEADCWMRICPSQYSKVSKSLSTSLQAFSCHLKHSKTVAFPNLQKMENSSIIIDLPFPHIGGEAIQRLKNDIVLAKAIDGTKYRKCFLCVRTSCDEPINPIGISSYVSELYSKSWNEAVAKRCFDTEFLVVNPLVTPQFPISRAFEEDHIVKVFTSAFIDDELHSLASSGSAVIIDSNSYFKNLDDGLMQNPDVVFLDSPNERLDLLPSYRFVAVGGSFDQLHNGHRKLLSFCAALCSERITVGVTGDAMLTAKSFQEIIDAFPKRYESVHSFLSMIKPSLKLNIVEINDPFGPAITDPQLEAIVVSSETITGGFKINQIREQQGMNLLKIFVLNRGDSAILSSTFLREQKYLANIQSSCNK